MPKPPRSPQATPPVEELLRRGLELHQSGRGEEAAGFYERVLTREPKNAAANHLLGLVLLGRGDAEGAVAHISRAVSVRSDAQYLGNLGAALNAAARHEEALAALQRAVSLKPEFAEAWSNLGMAYKELLKLDEAARSYRRAIEIRPNEAGFHFNLANVLASAGDIVPAEAEYREALRLRPGHAGAANALGALLGEEGRYEDGLVILATATGLAPNDAQLLLRRSRLQQQTGRLDEALKGYTRALELRPGFGEAHLHRATLRRHAAGDEAISAMRTLFADESVAAEDRIFAGFGLGKALADVADHSESVEVFLAANRLARSRAPFDLAKASAGLEADLVRAAQLSPASSDGRPGPIFVVGLPRAGKSTIESILSRHSGVAPVRELPTLGRLYKRLMTDGGSGAADPSRLAELGAAYLAESRRFVSEGVVTVDTMPSNYRLAGVIAAALPNARIIWCERRPQDHCIAILEKYLTGRGHEYSNDPDELVAFHAAYREAMAAWTTLLPQLIHTIDIAQLRSNPQERTAELLAFCGLDWEAACLLDAESEPQLGGWDSGKVAANRAAQVAAWQSRRPDLLGESAA